MTTNPEVLRRLQMARIPRAKKAPKPIAKVSAKKAKQNREEKKLQGDEDSNLQKWFKARRREMVGTCQCGCGMPSQKMDDMYFRHSAAHIFPKATFTSIMYHPLNFVERRFWGGCHTNMDERGLDLWPNMADWEDIKEKFHELASLLTDEERGTKFYQKLESLVYGAQTVAND